MKNCVRVFCCFIILFVITGIAQSSLTQPGKIRYPVSGYRHVLPNSMPTAETPPTLEKLLSSQGNLQAMGIDPTQFSAPVNASITKIEQTADGNYLVQVLLQAWVVNAWVNSFRYTYTYNTDGDRTQEIREIWQSNNWVNQMRIAYTYIAIGIASGSFWELWQMSQWVNYQRSTYTYNALLLTAVLWEYWQTSQWVNYYQYLYYHDKSDRVIEYVVQQWIASAWVNSYRYLYAYFTGTLLSEFLYQRWISEAWVNFQRETTTYKNGLRTQVLSQDWSGSAWVNAYLYLYTYGVTNLLLTYLVQEWITDAWYDYWDEWYYYDEYDDEIEIVGRRWITDRWVNYERFLFAYTLKRLVSQITYQRWEAATMRGSSSSEIALAESTWVDFQRQTGTYASTTDIGNDPPSIHSFKLYGNYPNPFNPGTEVRFEVSGLGFVSLKIYDVLGKEIATLVNETLPAGNYKRRWEANGLPGGVYFYRLITDGFSDVKKMVLVK